MCSSHCAVQLCCSVVMLCVFSCVVCVHTVLFSCVVQLLFSCVVVHTVLFSCVVQLCCSLCCSVVFVDVGVW